MRERVESPGKEGEVLRARKTEGWRKAAPLPRALSCGQYQVVQVLVGGQ